MKNADTLERKQSTLKWVQFLTQNLRIAEAFSATQVDLCGPFKTFSSKKKEQKSKFGLLSIAAMSTSTTLIKVMEDYSTAAFIQ